VKGSVIARNDSDEAIYVKYKKISMELKRYKLGEIGEIRMCKRILKEETNSVGGVPFFKIGTFGGQADVFITKEKFEEYKNAYSYPKKGDVLISAAGTIGRTVVFDGKDAYFQDSNIVWIENDESKVLNEYLFYCYKNIRWTTSVGSTILRLYNDDIRNTDIIVPPLSEQKKIASVLSTLDDKIALNKKMNQKLEAMAKRLYDYWFVQFDFPDKNGRPYKTTGGKMEYNPTLKREIPVGWEVKTIGDYLKIGNGRDHSKLADGLYPVYGSGGIMRYVAEYLHDGETVLFPRKGTLNNVMYRNEPLWTVDTMFYTSVLVPHSALFVFYSAKMFDFERLNTGTGVPSMTSDIIKKLPIISPGKQILEQFDRTLVKLYNQIHHNEKEISRLSEQRDKLLPLLMNGQVVVG